MTEPHTSWLEGKPGATMGSEEVHGFQTPGSCGQELSLVQKTYLALIARGKHPQSTEITGQSLLDWQDWVREASSGPRQDLGIQKSDSAYATPSVHPTVPSLCFLRTVVLTFLLLHLSLWLPHSARPSARFQYGRHSARFLLQIPSLSH